MKIKFLKWFHRVTRYIFMFKITLVFKPSDKPYNVFIENNHFYKIVIKFVGEFVGEYEFKFDIPNGFLTLEGKDSVIMKNENTDKVFINVLSANHIAVRNFTIYTQDYLDELIKLNRGNI